MKKYKIAIEEKLIKTVDIKACSLKEARKKVEKLYNSEEFVLDWSNFVSVSFQKIGYSENIKTALNEIINYLYKSEKKHFEECSKKERKNHIFTKIKLLKREINAF